MLFLAESKRSWKGFPWINQAYLDRRIPKLKYLDYYSYSQCKALCSNNYQSQGLTPCH